MANLTEKNLHDYQRTTVDFIIEHPYCGVFLDLGLGKTVSTLTAINALMFDYIDIKSVLVIAPKRVAESVWQEEAQKWGHLRHLTFSKIIGTAKQREDALRAKADIYIISRDNIVWLQKLLEGKRPPFDTIVIDELSSFKSHQAKRFKALRAIRPYVKRLIGLTGTPAPNSLIDLWPQIYLLDRGVRLGKTITQYRTTYFRPGRTNGHVVYNYVLQPEADKLIYDKIGDICISMKAKDFLNMPPRIDNYIRLEMPDNLKAQYKDFEKTKVLDFMASTQESGISAINAAVLSNKLLQFANGAVYDDDKRAHHIHGIKLDALQELIEDANGQSVLVAWAYQFDRDRIMGHFASLNPRELKGDKDIRDWNDGKIQLLLAHPASAGHGLNLQAGGHIIVWFGPTWSLELYQQFNARLYRQGQTQPVVINHLVLQGSHDEDVVKALGRKDKGQESLLASIKAKMDKYL